MIGKPLAQTSKCALLTFSGEGSEGLFVFLTSCSVKARHRLQPGFTLSYFYRGSRKPQTYSLYYDFGLSPAKMEQQKNCILTSFPCMSQERCSLYTRKLVGCHKVHVPAEKPPSIIRNCNRGPQLEKRRVFVLQVYA